MIFQRDRVTSEKIHLVAHQVNKTTLESQSGCGVSVLALVVATDELRGWHLCYFIEELLAEHRLVGTSASSIYRLATRQRAGLILSYHRIVPINVSEPAVTVTPVRVVSRTAVVD